MKELVRFALAALICFGTLSGIATAQNIPAIDIFGGYSYYRFDQPASGLTPYEQLQMNGWDVSASVGLLKHLAAEADFSGHQTNSCAGLSGFNCSNFSYMFGPRFTVGDRSSKLTFFAHGLIGRDNANLYGTNGANVSDTSISVAAGGGGVYWLFRHVGAQFGPFDYIYTNHLQNSGASGQGDFRVGGGVALRFGGDFPPPEPKAPKEPKSESGGHRSWIRPWHKTPAEAPAGQTAHTQAPLPAPKPPAAKPAPAPVPVPVPPPTRGMTIYGLGITAAPREFEGAYILSIEPGGVAEMASLHVGDMIKAVDGKAVRTPMELAAELSDKTGKVRLTFMRGNVTMETVILQSAH